MFDGSKQKKGKNLTEIYKTKNNFRIDQHHHFLYTMEPLMQLNALMLLMDGGRLELGRALGSGFSLQPPFCWLYSRTDRGPDQQEDPCPVKHNPDGLRWSEGNLWALSVKVCSPGPALLYKQGLNPTLCLCGWKSPVVCGLWSQPSPSLFTYFAQCTGILVSCVR